MPTLSNRTVLLALIAIVALGAFLRFAAVLGTVVDAPLRADAGDYFSYAYNLDQFGVYSRSHAFLGGDRSLPAPDAIRSPGYPLLLSLLMEPSPSGQTLLNITLLQALLGVLMVWLVFVLGRQCLSPGWALLAALLTAVSPQLVVSGTYVLTETLFSFLLLLVLAAVFTQYRFSSRLWIALLSGMVIGAATLTRPTLQYLMLLLLPLVYLVLPRSLRWQHMGLMVLGFVLVFGPWLVRNQVVLGGSDPTLTINALVHGHYPGMMYEHNPRSFGYPYRFDPRVAELSASVEAAVSGIIERMRAAPAEYLAWYAIGKPLAFFGWADAASAGDIFTYPVIKSPYQDVAAFVWTKKLMQLTHGVWIILALLAVMVTGWRWLRSSASDHAAVMLRLLSIVVLYFIAIHIVAFPLARYCVPLLPVLFLLAAYMLSVLVAQWRARFSYEANHGK